MLSYNPNEHFGIVPLEAQAAGCVPIVADGGGQRETVLHNETGFRMSSPTDFSVYVKELLTKDSLFQEMSERGKMWANNFSYEEIEAKWNNLLVSLIDAKHGRAR
jgi:glycosyltransferase involved in cell wall biosynthesis